MEFGEMETKHVELEQFCMLLHRAGLSASAGLSCIWSESSITRRRTCVYLI